MNKVTVKIQTWAGVVTSLDVGGEDFPFGEKDFFFDKEDGDLISLKNTTLVAKLAAADLTFVQRTHVNRMLKKSDAIVFGSRVPDNNGLEFREVEF